MDRVAPWLPVALGLIVVTGLGEVARGARGDEAGTGTTSDGIPSSGTSAEALRLLTLDHPSFAASLAWMRASALWSDEGSRATSAPAITTSIEAARALDPSWTTPAWLGSTMLDRLGRADDARRGTP